MCTLALPYHYLVAVIFDSDIFIGKWQPNAMPGETKRRERMNKIVNDEMAKSNSVSKNIVVVLTALPKLSWYFLNVTISSTSPIERFSNNNFQRDFRQNWVGNWFHFPCFFWLTLFVFAFLLCHLFLMTELSTFGLHKILMAVVSTQTTTRAKFLEYSNFDETATMNRIISASDNSQEHMTNSLDRRHRELNNPKKNFWNSFRS